jgi:hypothetical protein
MRLKNVSILLFGLLLILAGLAACNRPASTPKSQPAIGEPELTLTALFAMLETAQAEQSKVPPTPIVLASNTPAEQPTEQATEQAPETATEPAVVAPMPTATGVPPISAPTSTQAPTRTPERVSGPDKRAGSGVVANYLQREPTIDGVFEEWNLDRYEVDAVVYGDNRHSGEDDLSGTVMVGWDDYFIYIAARVRDDTFVQAASGEDLFLGDSLEILLDIKVSQDFYLQDLNSDDYQIGLSPGNFTSAKPPESYVWYPKTKEGVYNEIKLAAVQTDNGYRLEAKIPWTLFGVKPDIGQNYGIAISISDNDRAGEMVQQSMVSNAPRRILTDPTSWVDFRLAGRP